MPFVERDGLRFYQFESLADESVVHGIFTRQGGVSPAPWTSLNLGTNLGDSAARVAENRLKLLRALDRPPDSTFDIWQVHSAKILKAERPRRGEPYPQADGVITDKPEVTILLRFADCVPILLHDPVRDAVGMVHAGWKGTMRKAALAAVRAMITHFGSRPEDLTAAIGPAIGQDHYPVGGEVVTALRKRLGDLAHSHEMQLNGQVHLDLPGINRDLLRHAGIRRIEVLSLCTACHAQVWFSHRAEKGKTGRFGAVIALESIHRD